MRDCNLEMYMIWRSFSGCREPLTCFDYSMKAPTRAQNRGGYDVGKRGERTAATQAGSRAPATGSIGRHVGDQRPDARRRRGQHQRTDGLRVAAGWILPSAAHRDELHGAPDPEPGA